ncbi:peptidase B [Vibrio halioticoli NBRC 102217]|uniref:Peptidase B n=1 Tax=Vibrio halioticoli NBRC 102217 TaxID=1219072 RepID=V5HPW9_9VIBR|nr:aminopeptidase PepB [Vibrio halioticoli]GAD91300.1 peptidase B [Vibrio halioticoli NBRC 102217]
MSTAMQVSLSTDKAAPQWGENAVLSHTEQGCLVHIGQTLDYSAIQKAARKLDGQGIKEVSLVGELWDLETIWSFAQSFRNPKRNNTLEWQPLAEADEKELQDRIKVANWTRDIINKSAEEVAPRQLATMAGELIKSVAEEGQVTYRIVKDKDLLTGGWEGIYAVGRGSARTSAMLQLDFNPTGNPDAPVMACLVGKGITFDSGGYSLKPSQFMTAMKSDMGGAATITGGLALAILRALNKRVKLILCCAENMISGRAIKLGDVITYKNGKTVEVMNTDAEGRLVLADGLIYASEQHPELIIDCATLTGAAKNALGNDFHALLSFDNALSEQALACAAEEKEGLWPLPLADFHRGMLPSNFADLSNISSGDYSPGASTAAAFLSYFVEDYKTGWLHFDCAGAYRKSASDKWAAGGTGMGIRTLANLLNNQ